MAKLVIREDGIGLYVKHGDRKARPIPDRYHVQLWPRPGDPPLHTLFEKGCKAMTHHVRQTTTMVLIDFGFFGEAGNLVEYWFIFDSDEDAKKTLDEIEGRRNSVS